MSMNQANKPSAPVKAGNNLSFFERYLTVWVVLCIITGILLGIAPCTAMVLMWGYLSYGNQGHTLVMVAVNSLAMLFLYAPLGRWLLAANDLSVPWQTIALSVLIYVGLPLLAGMYSRYWILKHKRLTRQCKYCSLQTRKLN